MLVLGIIIFATPIVISRTNLRNHRKLVLIDRDGDSARLWNGGRNLATEYFEGSATHPPWRDLSFELTGPLLRQASQLFERDWCFAKGLPLPWPSTGARNEQAAPDGEGAQLVSSG